MHVRPTRDAYAPRPGAYAPRVCPTCGAYAPQQCYVCVPAAFFFRARGPLTPENIIIQYVLKAYQSFSSSK